MKKTAFISCISFLILFVFGIASISHAQMRKDQQNNSELSGPIVKEDPSKGADWRYCGPTVIFVDRIRGF